MPVQKRPRVLIANRSEIACRIAQACEEYGFDPIALHVDGDEGSRHLQWAREWISVPSYLDLKAVVQAARDAGADFVHPGYGFLSERSEFVEALEQAGIGFIGPRAETMKLLGGKMPSKELAERIGVPTLPWARVPESQKLTEAEWKQLADRIEFPLLIKASSGGGGKGMRVVEASHELALAAETASAEAVAAFGEGSLFLERRVEHARHIEVQVFGDGAGGGVACAERECSLQRRHQKVWEEAPAPHLSQKMREGLREAALKLVAETRYRGAGTVEFLVDDARQGFYFLEVNTRLQVEHTVTEEVLGIDLVHAQLELALNPGVMPPLLKDVESAPPRGHSIEVRILAEDPSQGFLPTPGKIQRLEWPTGSHIRVESGVSEGQVITPQFDSMLAKLIVWAPTRSLAIQRLAYALDRTVILGLGTNLSYLRSMCRDPDVILGKVHTHFLESEFAPRFKEWIDCEWAQVAAIDPSILKGAVHGGAAASSSGGARSQQPASPWTDPRWSGGQRS